MKKHAFSYPILLKLAGFEKEALSNATTYGLGGAAAGALLGALVDRKKRLRGALLGALVGGAGGYGLGYQRDYVSDRKQKDEANRQAMRRDAHRKAFEERLDATDRELARYGLEPEFRPGYHTSDTEDYNDRLASGYIEEANNRIAGHGVDRGAVTVKDIADWYWGSSDKQYDKLTKVLGLTGIEDALVRAANVKPTIEGSRIPFHAGKSKDDITWMNWLAVHGDEPAVRYLNADR